MLDNKTGSVDELRVESFFPGLPSILHLVFDLLGVNVDFDGLAILPVFLRLVHPILELLLVLLKLLDLSIDLLLDIVGLDLNLREVAFLDLDLFSRVVELVKSVLFTSGCLLALEVLANVAKQVIGDRIVDITCVLAISDDPRNVVVLWGKTGSLFCNGVHKSIALVRAIGRVGVASDDRGGDVIVDAKVTSTLGSKLVVVGAGVAFLDALNEEALLVRAANVRLSAGLDHIPIALGLAVLAGKVVLVAVLSLKRVAVRVELDLGHIEEALSLHGCQKGGVDRLSATLAL